jgi:hypothetical protein
MNALAVYLQLNNYYYQTSFFFIKSYWTENINQNSSAKHKAPCNT